MFLTLFRNNTYLLSFDLCLSVERATVTRDFGLGLVMIKKSSRVLIQRVNFEYFHCRKRTRTLSRPNPVLPKA